MTALRLLPSHPPLDVDRLRRLMCDASGHRPDTGSSTQLERVPVLSAVESGVVAELLTELAETGEPPLAVLATEMANRLRDRLSL